MKQVELNADILAKLKASVGNDVDTSNLAIFEAIALNSLPIRKKHPLYFGAVADRAFQEELAAALNKESRPVYLMHKTDADTPVGRVFFATVQNNYFVDETRALFFIDKTAHPDIVGKLDNGTLDQVSVNLLSKQLINSVSGFDYFGPDSDIFENIMTGTDPDGNTLGKNGVYGKLVGLDSFFEMSLVGQGGAQNARVVNRGEQKIGSANFQRLAASGADPSLFALAASTGSLDMPMEKLVTDLTDAKVNLALETSKVTDLTTKLTAETAKVTDLSAKLTAALAEVEAAKADTSAEDLKLATDSIRDVALKVLVASGKVDAKTDTMDVKTCVETINDNSKTLAAKLALSSKDTSERTPLTAVSSSAYRTR